MWLIASLLVLRLFLVRGQSDSDGFNSYVCNKTFNDANATGIFSFNPTAMGVSTGNATANISWAYTIHDNPGNWDELVLWFSSGGLNYTDDTTLGYDVCGIQLVNLNADYGVSDEAARLGAADTGDCVATLGQSCVNALNQIAANTADLLVDNPTPGPNSNVTNGILPTICGDIGTAIQKNFPKECTQAFGGSMTPWSFIMTDHNNASYAADPNCCSDDVYIDPCTIIDPSAPERPLYAIEALVSDTANDSNYDNMANSAAPMMTVFLPIADYLRKSSIQSSTSVLTCPHINHFNPGSRVSPPIPPPAAKGLSKGAIAGIVIGAVAFVAILAGLASWLLRRRKQRGRRHSEPPPAYTADAKKASPMAEPTVEPSEDPPVELGSAEKTELPAVERLSELPALEPVELDNSQKQAELSLGSPVSELDGNRSPV